MLGTLATGAWVLTGLLLGYTILSITYLHPNEVAVIFKFGRPYDVKGAGGLIWYPLFIFQVMRVMTDVIRVTIPTVKEKTVKDDDVPLKDDEMRPLHINHQEAKNARFWLHEDRDDPNSPWVYIPFSKLSEEERKGVEDDAMQGAITSEVTAHVDFSIGKKKLDAKGRPTEEWDKQSFFDYVQRVRSPKAAAARLYGTTRSGLVELLSPMTSRNATDAKPKIESLIKERLEVTTGEKADPVSKEFTEQALGLNIRAVEIEEFELGKHVNQGRARGAAAIEILKETKKQADGEAYTIEEKGKAEGKADKARGEGRAEAIKCVALAMGEPNAQFAAVLETTEKVAQKANFIIAPEMGGLAATISAIAKGTQDVVANLPPKGKE